MEILKAQDVLAITIYLIFSIFLVIGAIGGFCEQHNKKYSVTWYWGYLYGYLGFFAGMVLIYAAQQIWGIFHLFPWMYKIVIGSLFFYINFELTCLFKIQFQYERNHSLYGVGGKEDGLALFRLAIAIPLIIFLPVWISIMFMSGLFGIWYWFKTFFPSRIPTKQRLSFLYPKKKAGFEIVDAEGNENLRTFKITGKRDRLFLRLLGHESNEISLQLLKAYREDARSRYSGNNSDTRDNLELIEIAYRHLIRVINGEID